jgi:predicted metal-dependent HD superfamily phosphohydrolase
MAAQMIHATQQRFVELCARMAVPERDARMVHADLAKRYGEAHRHYHTLVHVDRMLGLLDETGLGNDRIELAIWFHDCVYDPLASDNEAASARRFQGCMGGGLDSAFARDVFRLA